MWAWRWAAAFRGMALADSALGRLMGQAVALTVTLACAVLVALGSWLLCSVQVAVVDVALVTPVQLRKAPTLMHVSFEGRRRAVIPVHP